MIKNIDLDYYLKEIEQKLLAEHKDILVNEILPKIINAKANTEKYKYIESKIENYIIKEKHKKINLIIMNDKKYYSLLEKSHIKQPFVEFVLNTQASFVKNLGLLFLTIVGVFIFYCSLEKFWAWTGIFNKESLKIIVQLSITLISLFILNRLNYLYNFKIPLFFVFGFYALLNLFSPIIKYKLLNIYLPKIDFDPLILILASYIYLLLFYTLPILFLFISIFTDFLIFLISVIKKNNNNLIYRVESFSYTTLKRIEEEQFKFIFNFFGFKDFELKNYKSRKIYIILFIFISLITTQILSFYSDFEKIKKSYIFFHSTKNNNYCKNLQPNILIIKDQYKVWILKDFTLERVDCQ